MLFKLALQPSYLLGREKKTYQRQQIHEKNEVLFAVLYSHHGFIGLFRECGKWPLRSTLVKADAQHGDQLPYGDRNTKNSHVQYFPVLSV